MSKFFHDYSSRSDLEEGWAELVEDEKELRRSEHNHVPREFSGTRSVRPHPTITEPIPEDETQPLLDERESVLQPGEAEGIPVFWVQEARFKRTGDLHLQVVVDPKRVKDRDYMREQILQSVPEDWFEQLGRRARSWENPPEHLSASNIIFWRTDLENRDEHRARAYTDGLDLKEKLETRYVLVNMSDGSFATPLRWEDSYATAHDALAAAPMVLPEDEMRLGPQEMSYGVVGVVMRKDGEPLATRRLIPSESTLSLLVSIGYRVGERKVTDERGWLIYGRA